MNLLAKPIFSSIPTHSTKNPSKITSDNHSPLRTFTVTMSHMRKRRCDLYDLHKELVPYAEAWSWQNEIVNEKKSLIEKNEDFSDTLIILQHHPVYTLGAGSSEEFLNFDKKNSPIDLYRTERGGEVTYHGPGQIVMYPIINLRYHKEDLHWYLRALEEVVIRALSSMYSIEATRVEGLTGVWVGNRKLAAIGVKVSKWITYHGLALNVTTDITPFQHIVPCGIRDRQVGSIKGLLQESNHHIDDYELIDRAQKSLINEFCEVFHVELLYKSRVSQKQASLKRLEAELFQ